MRPLALVLLLAIGCPAAALSQPVTGLSDWSLFIDPGHSRTQNQGIFGYSEAEKVLRVSLEMKRLFETHTDIGAVYISRTNDNAEVSLSQRVDLANARGASFFHSVHSNAGPASARSLFVLWPQRVDGSEGVPNGGRRMAEVTGPLLAQSMRVPAANNGSGAFGECDFYGVSSCRTSTSKGGRNFVQSFTNMASMLSEASFHTNPEQNQRNMNADWKRMEAKTIFWAMLEYHSLDRPEEQIVMGIVTDIETGRPLNGVTVSLGDTTYTTDSYATLFNRYSDDPDLLANGFYYLDDLAPGAQAVRVEHPGYRTFETTVTPRIDTFTFQDIQLISNVPPRIAESTPEDEASAFRIVDDLRIRFTRSMDRAAVEAALRIEPAIDASYVWSDRDRRLTIRPDALEPLTNYTITIDASARGVYNDGFDGDSDGVAGGDWTLHFTTGPRDAFAPRLIGSYPRVNSRDAGLDDPVTLFYDEVINFATFPAAATFTDGVGDVDGTFTHYVVDERSLVTFFPDAPLQPATDYTLAVAPGVEDVFGNAETVARTLRFTTGEERYASARSLDTFNSDFLVNWWFPQQSGTTTGIVTDSTTIAPDGLVFNPRLGGRQAMRLDYGWQAGAANALIRTYLNRGAPRSVLFTDTRLLRAYVFGDGSGTRFRFAVDDKVPTVGAANHEVSPWVEVDWVGWQPVVWDLRSGETGTWLGNGVLEGQLRFDSFQLAPGDDGVAFGTLYIDDLELLTPVSTVANEGVAELPTQAVLHPAYPNPFNPSTRLRYTLPAASEVTVAVFNLLGARVATLVDGQQRPAGEHSLIWEAGALPSGSYLVRLAAGGTVQTTTVTLIK
ncbi:MAG: Ig-like domain-containing protein [Bacteroidota bacterium]